eukprot:6184266-Pleurochrysis_carterae.AAC.1
MPSEPTSNGRWRRVTRNADGREERNGYGPSPRWKCSPRRSAPARTVCSSDGGGEEGGSAAASGDGMTVSCAGCKGAAGRGRGSVDGGAGCVVAVGAAPSKSEARGRRDAIARAIMRLRSGGNAEEDADVHAPLDRTPPHCRA